MSLEQKGIAAANLGKNRLQYILNYVKSYTKAVVRYKKSFMDENSVVSFDANREGRRLFKYGNFIANLVEGYVQSGELEEAQKEWLNSTCDIIRLLSKIEGMGPIQAAELVEQGINSVDKLFCNTDKLTRQQIIGLEHFHDLNIKIPLKEVQELFEKIANCLVGYEKQVVLTGEGRRCRPKCGQIDCLLASNEKNAVAKLLEILKEIIIDVICIGPTKLKAVCRLDENYPVRRLVIRLASTEQLPYLLLYHTGPPKFVKKLTKDGLKRGLKIFEHTMRRICNNEAVLVTSEEEIFLHLGVTFVPPESR